MLATTGGNKERKLPAEGMTPARCVAVIDLGTHTDERFKKDNGQPSRRHMVQIQWELPTQMDEWEGQQRPMQATKRYNLSVNERATLRKDLQSWYGKEFPGEEELASQGGFRIEKLLGRPALLNLAHSPDGKFANVVSVNPPMAGMSVPPQINQSRLFDLQEPSAEVWKTLSEKTREYIAQSEEVQSGRVILPGEAVPSDPMAAAAGIGDEEVPF
jgi:hypothetical protein